MTTTTTNNNSQQLSVASKWQPLRLAAVAAVGVAATEANRSSRNSLHPTPAARASWCGRQNVSFHRCRQVRSIALLLLLYFIILFHASAFAQKNLKKERTEEEKKKAVRGRKGKKRIRTSEWTNEREFTGRSGVVQLVVLVHRKEICEFSFSDGGFTAPSHTILCTAHSWRSVVVVIVVVVAVVLFMPAYYCRLATQLTGWDGTNRVGPQLLFSCCDLLLFTRFISRKKEREWKARDIQDTSVTSDNCESTTNCQLLYPFTNES